VSTVTHDASLIPAKAVAHERKFASAFVSYYGELFKYAWRETVRVLRWSVAFSIGLAVFTFIFSLALAPDEAARNLLIAVLSLAALWILALVVYCVRLPVRFDRQRHKQIADLQAHLARHRRDLTAGQQKHTLRMTMRGIAHRCREAMEQIELDVGGKGNGKYAVEPVNIHRQAIGFARDAQRCLDGLNYPHEEEAISRAVTRDWPEDLNAALAEMNELQRVIDALVYQGSFD
jgi:uncharacterized membrane protein (DUF485 family)